MSEPEDQNAVTAAATSAPPSGRFSGRGWRLLAGTLAGCMRYRVTGLAAEAAFFTILSLPPLIFGLAGAIGFVAAGLNVATIASFQQQILTLASRVLTANAVTNVLQPTLTNVLSTGRFEIISIGFVLALWSGSRALNVFVDTITIMYGMAGRRGIVATRALAFGLYLIFLLLSVILVPLVLAGPGVVELLLPARLEGLSVLYWPVVLLGSTVFLATLYRASVPVRSRLRAELPGALVALVMWVGGSVLLRLVLNASAGSTTVYGPLAAPIAVLIWLYLISIAVLVGAAFNASLNAVWPGLADIARQDREAPTRAQVASGRILARLPWVARRRRLAEEKGAAPR